MKRAVFCIHHFAIEVEDLKRSTAELHQYGCEIISDPGVIPGSFAHPAAPWPNGCP